jgi:thioredoxin-like negative regulator of GroEL
MCPIFQFVFRGAFAITLVASLLVPSVGRAGTAEQAFRDGNRLVAAGDLRGALKAYADAARANRENSEYAQQYMLVRRVLLLEDALSKETEKADRLAICESLRTFYVSHNAYRRALALDEEIFEATGTSYAAIQLAETHLSLKQEAAAVRVLEGLDSESQSRATQALLAIALARSGKRDAARQIAAGLPATHTDPGTLYLLARMQATVGQGDVALSTLKRCFQSIPPSRQGALKSHAKACLDFASLVHTDGFAASLNTESKVAESSCSGGSSCGSCPMRGSCSGAQ